MVTADTIIAAIGNFDGVHLGHQHLLRETARFAREHGAQAGVVVFDPHPRRFFQPDAPPFLLARSDQREEYLRAAGADHVISLRFDADLAALSPQAFVQDVLAKRLGLAGALTGADFRFGAGRAGDGAALKALGEAAGLKIRLVELAAEKTGAEKYGSSAIRDALRQGRAKAAAAMLGRPWMVRGVVKEGQRLGRDLGFPTANMMLGDYLEPLKGVYAVRAVVRGKTLPGVANFGRRPTVGADAPLLETHLFDFEGDLYGETVDVSFIDFIREEQKFDGLDALKAQIMKDTQTARSILA
ncbi:MAG: bifunctional riboflavin kinase/FAD synthetase [Hyphococcus sp.]